MLLGGNQDIPLSAAFETGTQAGEGGSPSAAVDEAGNLPAAGAGVGTLPTAEADGGTLLAAAGADILPAAAGAGALPTAEADGGILLAAGSCWFADGHYCKVPTQQS